MEYVCLVTQQNELIIRRSWPLHLEQTVLFVACSPYHWLGCVMGRRCMIRVGSRGALPGRCPCLHCLPTLPRLLIRDTYLDLFACGGCGYRLSLVTEAPTPYVVEWGRGDCAHACYAWNRLLLVAVGKERMPTCHADGGCRYPS